MLKSSQNQKIGRPLLLGDELDRQVQSYILELRNNGGVINSAITIAVAQGIVTNFDSNLLVQNGGHVDLTKSWAKYRGGGGTQNLRGPNMLPGYICMEKIIILWSNCKSWGGKCPFCPPCSASPEVLVATLRICQEEI